MATALLFASYGAVAALVAAVGACAIGRWTLAITISRALVLTGPLILLAGFAGLMVCSPQARDPSAQAAVLAQGTSEALNCGALVAIVTSLSAAVWAFGRWRVRASRPSN